VAKVPWAGATEWRGRAHWVVVALCIALSVPTTWVQLLGPFARSGDYGAHLASVVSLQHGHLDVPHPVFHAAVAVLGFLLSNTVATFVVMAVAQVAFGLLVFHLLCDAFEAGLRDGALAARRALAVTAALLISAAICVFTFPHLFLGYVSTATYHNPTIQVLKPLALALFLRLDDDVLARPPARRISSGLLGLALLSAITTLAKPSFSIVALPALMVMVVVYRRSIPLRGALATLAVFGLAAGAVIVWQSLFLFTGGHAGNGIEIRPFEVALMFAPNWHRLVAKLLLSVAFPLSALIFNPRAALADRRLVFSYACFAVSLLYYLLLAEQGGRASHGNFGWGVMTSLVLVFVSTAAMLARRGATARRATLMPWLVLAVHAVSGLVWLTTSWGLLSKLCYNGYNNWCW
jgi:hypothetical protein